MKKLFKILGAILCVLLLLILAGVAFIHFKGIPGYENKAPTLTVKADSASIAEGARMATMMCANGCHHSDDGKLGGSYMGEVKEFGEIYAPNVTQHPQIRHNRLYRRRVGFSI